MKLSILVMSLLCLTSQAKVLKTKDNKVVIDDLKYKNLDLGDEVKFKNAVGEVTGKGNIIGVKKHLAVVRLEEGYAYKNYRVVSSVKKDPTLGSTYKTKKKNKNTSYSNIFSIGVSASFGQQTFQSDKTIDGSEKRADLDSEDKEIADDSVIEIGMDLNLKLTDMLSLTTTPSFLFGAKKIERSYNSNKVEADVVSTEMRITQKVNLDIETPNGLIFSPYVSASYGKAKSKYDSTYSFGSLKEEDNAQITGDALGFGAGAKLKFQTGFHLFAEFQKVTYSNIKETHTLSDVDNTYDENSERKENYLKLGIGYTF